jgi:hypothetical protein
VRKNKQYIEIRKHENTNKLANLRNLQLYDKKYHNVRYILSNYANYVTTKQHKVVVVFGL